MTQFNFLMSIGFRLINFAVVIALGIFFYRRSLRGMVLDLKQKKIDRLRTLEGQTAMLRADQLRLEQEKRLQEHEGKDLLALVHKWRSVVATALDTAALERDVLHDKAVQRAASQEKNWYYSLVQKAAFEPTLTAAEMKLKKKYSSPQNGGQYLAPIIKHLKK